jgi:hypothetical protein
VHSLEEGGERTHGDGISRTEVGVDTFLAEQVALVAGQRFACTLEAERTTVETAHGLIAEALLQGGLSRALVSTCG